MWGGEHVCTWRRQFGRFIGRIIILLTGSDELQSSQKVRFLSKGRCRGRTLVWSFLLKLFINSQPRLDWVTETCSALSVSTNSIGSDVKVFPELPLNWCLSPATLWERLPPLTKDGQKPTWHRRWRPSWWRKSLSKSAEATARQRDQPDRRGFHLLRVQLYRQTVPTGEEEEVSVICSAGKGRMGKWPIFVQGGVKCGCWWANGWLQKHLPTSAEGIIWRNDDETNFGRF